MGEGVPAAVWLVDKPAGPTSHDIVATARRRVGPAVRVGHAGTLDPFATGLLVLLIGRATRLARFLTGLDKTYEALVQLGASSATGDPEGPIVAVGPPPTRQALESALGRFRGEHDQSVPALAAVKVDGERLYRRTRRGEQVSTPTRRVRIDELGLLDGPDAAGRARLKTRVSSGTYIRQLAADIGSDLGCGAYCAGLRRTRVGQALRIEDACPVEDVQTTGGVGLLTAVAHLPRRELSPEEVVRVTNGRMLDGERPGSEVALVRDQQLYAIARGQDGGLQPIVVLV